MGTPDDQSDAGRDANEAAELAARRAERFDAEAKQSRHSAVEHMDTAARYEKLAEDAENSGRHEYAEEMRHEAARHMAEASRAADLAKMEADLAKTERMEAGDHAHPHQDPHDPFNSLRQFQQDLDRINAHVTGDASATPEHDVQSQADPMGLQTAPTSAEGDGVHGGEWTGVHAADPPYVTDQHYLEPDDTNAGLYGGDFDGASATDLGIGTEADSMDPMGIDADY